MGIEVKNLKMRVESLASRLEFNERRARALESAVVYKPAVEQAADRGFQHVRRRRADPNVRRCGRPSRGRGPSSARDRSDPGEPTHLSHRSHRATPGGQAPARRKGPASAAAAGAAVAAAAVGASAAVVMGERIAVVRRRRHSHRRLTSTPSTPAIEHHGGPGVASERLTA